MILPGTPAKKFIAFDTPLMWRRSNLSNAPPASGCLLLIRSPQSRPPSHGRGDGTFASPGRAMPDLVSTLTGEELFDDILHLEYGAEHESHLVQRRGLRCVNFRRDGQLVRRFLPSDVADWLRAESGKKSDKADGAEASRCQS